MVLELLRVARTHIRTVKRSIVAIIRAELILHRAVANNISSQTTVMPNAGVRRFDVRAHSLLR